MSSAQPLATPGSTTARRASRALRDTRSSFDLCWALDLVRPWVTRYRSCNARLQPGQGRVRADTIEFVRYWPRELFAGVRAPRRRSADPAGPASTSLAGRLSQLAIGPVRSTTGRDDGAAAGALRVRSRPGRIEVARRLRSCARARELPESIDGRPAQSSTYYFAADPSLRLRRCTGCIVVCRRHPRARRVARHERRLAFALGTAGELSLLRLRRRRSPARALDPRGPERTDRPLVDRAAAA